MKKLVVTSKSCLAGINMFKYLDCDKRVLDSSIVELDGLPSLGADLIIVASTHKSESGTPSFTAHAPGNFGANTFDGGKLGGEPKKLSIAPSQFIGDAIRKFSEIKHREGLKYDVSLEVTHHGPTFDIPIVFVEVGSSEVQWRDDKAIRAAVEVIEHILENEPEGESAIGLGGPHYAPNFTKRVLGGWNFGHICPKYALGDLNEELFTEMIEKTRPRPKKVLLDWKGIPSEHRATVIDYAENAGLIIEKVR